MGKGMLQVAHEKAIAVNYVKFLNIGFPTLLGHGIHRYVLLSRLQTIKLLASSHNFANMLGTFVLEVDAK